MVTATTIYLTEKQRRSYFRRARKRKTSFSEEVRGALDLYLEFPPNFDKEQLAALAREASASLGRSGARLDKAIVRIKMTVGKLAEFGRRLDELAEGRV